MARMLGSTGTDHGGRRMPLVADVSSPGATTSERRDSSNQPIVPRGAGGESELQVAAGGSAMVAGGTCSE